jgi:hypothetical protein
MGHQKWEHFISTYFNTIQSYSYKIGIYGEREQSSLSAIMLRPPEANNLLKLDLELLSIRLVEGHYFQMVSIVCFSEWN